MLLSEIGVIEGRNSDGRSDCRGTVIFCRDPEERGLLSWSLGTKDYIFTPGPPTEDKRQISKHSQQEGRSLGLRWRGMEKKVRRAFTIPTAYCSDGTSKLTALDRIVDGTVDE